MSIEQEKQVDGDQESIDTSTKEESKSFEDILQDPAYKDKIQSYIDSAVNRGIQTYKEKTLPKEIEREAAKLREKQDEEFKDMSPREREMYETVKQMKEEQEKTAKEARLLKNQKLATDKLKDLNATDFADILLRGSEDETEEFLGEKLDTLSKIIYERDKRLEKELLKNNNIKVPGQTTLSGGALKEPGEGATKDQWKEYWAKLRATGQ